jgi:hypothetical protein
VTIASTDTLVNELNSAGNLPAEFGRLSTPYLVSGSFLTGSGLTGSLSIGYRSLTCGCGPSTPILLS